MADLRHPPATKPRDRERGRRGVGRRYGDTPTGEALLYGIKLTVPSLGPLVLTQTTIGAPIDLLRLFGIFLKIGAVLYGSGYVLLAFLRGDLVQRLVDRHPAA